MSVQIPSLPQNLDDFVRNPESTSYKYRGRIFDVEYPANKKGNLLNQLIGWSRLGYYAFGSVNDDGRGFTIQVHGDIPQMAQDAVRENHILFRLVKERGTEVEWRAPYDWDEH